MQTGDWRNGSVPASDLNPQQRQPRRVFNQRRFHPEQTVPPENAKSGGTQNVRDPQSCGIEDAHAPGECPERMDRGHIERLSGWIVKNQS